VTKQSATISRLIDTVQQLQFTATPLAGDDMLEAVGLCFVRVTLCDQAFDLLLDNEYGDVDDLANLPLVLNMVLMAMDDVEEEGDAFSWAQALGLPAGDPKTEELWANQQKACVAIKPLLPPGLEPISSWDWSLGAGDAPTLRGLKGAD
jgi:hypothetical protein